MRNPINPSDIREGDFVEFSMLYENGDFCEWSFTVTAITDNYIHSEFNRFLKDLSQVWFLISRPERGDRDLLESVARTVAKTDGIKVAGREMLESPVYGPKATAVIAEIRKRWDIVPKQNGKEESRDVIEDVQ